MSNSAAHQGTARGVGIDGLSFSFPVASYLRDRAACDSRRATKEVMPEQSESLSAAFNVGHGMTVIASVFQAESEWETRMCRLDFNPARLLNPSGLGLASVGDLAP